MVGVEVTESSTNKQHHHLFAWGGGGYGVNAGERAGTPLFQLFSVMPWLGGNGPLSVCFITAGPITKLCAWGEEESGGHVL
jgi:hypothetical protein